MREISTCPSWISICREPCLITSRYWSATWAKDWPMEMSMMPTERAGNPRESSSRDTISLGVTRVSRPTLRRTHCMPLAGGRRDGCGSEVAGFDFFVPAAGGASSVAGRASAGPPSRTKSEAAISVELNPSSRRRSTWVVERFPRLRTSRTLSRRDSTLRSSTSPAVGIVPRRIFVRVNLSIYWSL